MPGAMAFFHPKPVPPGEKETPGVCMCLCLCGHTSGAKTEGHPRVARVADQ